MKIVDVWAKKIYRRQRHFDELGPRWVEAGCGMEPSFYPEADCPDRSGVARSAVVVNGLSCLIFKFCCGQLISFFVSMKS